MAFRRATYQCAFVVYYSVGFGYIFGMETKSIFSVIRPNPVVQNRVSLPYDGKDALRFVETGLIRPAGKYTMVIIWNNEKDSLLMWNGMHVVRGSI
jgi:hypothetical protein